jgi:hypothetical protein
MKSVRYDRTLLEYDGPQVFLARDLSGNPYIGVLIDQKEAVDRYVVVQVLRPLLEMFFGGEIDLLRLMLSRVGPGWYLTEIADNFESSISLVLQPNSLEDFPHLPQAGLYIKEAEDRFKSAYVSAEWSALNYWAYHIDSAFIPHAALSYFQAHYSSLAPYSGTLLQKHLELGFTQKPTGVLDASMMGMMLTTDVDPLHAANTELALAA